ncbi:DinB family protein [Salegentibacter salegens]|uniref:DinB superfamily protein n=1 Tax=Salegentibacter salegens TaxID=143223 RepID=A0A1M7MR35_9FLAO|nr:DinB family protein [Salegentibacter salegens]PRX52565.1 DinB family protein [Salegentibacter salegens]SHM93482.1 DinB superfamily protein [Salegentibacter salegens]
MQEFTHRLDELTLKFKKTFGQLSEREIHWKPDADSWSIAQNLEHLILINESYFPLIDRVRTKNHKKPFIARFGFLVNFFGKVILKSVQPETTKKTKTFSIWKPSEDNTSKDILARFIEHQEKLKQKILGAEDLLKQNVVISSPANPKIVYKLDAAFKIILAHEERHFQQAKKLLEIQNSNL